MSLDCIRDQFKPIDCHVFYKSALASSGSMQYKYILLPPDMFIVHTVYGMSKKYMKIINKKIHDLN